MIIMDCENIATCNFFKHFEENLERQMVLRGFIRIYCKGDRQDKCMRKQISKRFGGGQFVPSNMMPNGFPLPTTNNLEWSDDVKSAIIELKRK